MNDFQISVSVIIPNYNSGKYIQAAIGSVLSQSYTDIEVIVVDDGSLDESLNYLKDLEGRDTRVRILFTEGGLGPAKARNRGISISRGRYLAFLDSDDIWLGSKLSQQIDFMSQNSLALSCTGVKVVDNLDRAYGTRIPNTNIQYSALITNTVVTSSVIVDRKITGYFEMPDIARRQDLALWLKLVKRFGLMGGLPTVLAAYRVHKKSYSRNKIKSAVYTWKVIYKVEDNSLLTSIYLFSRYAFKGLISRIKGIN